MNSLPDGLADALGRVVADVRQEFRKDLERLGTESRLVIAELRADVFAFKAELKTAADRELSRVPEVLASVKDGAPGKDGENGAPGRDGVDGSPGKDGVDGEAADPDAILKMVTEAVGAIPVPKDGRDGKDITPKEIQGTVAAEVAKAFSEFPQPKDGAPGKDGAEGIPGRDGRDGLVGTQGEKGIDGVNGKDGRDGVDGLGFDDFSVEHDGERTVTMKWAKGDRVEERPIVFPVTIYRGIYKLGAQYRRGDSVTFAGSTHIAENDTTEKPETGKDWRLAVKRGRDGQDGIVKEAPKPKVVKV